MVWCRGLLSVLFARSLLVILFISSSIGSAHSFELQTLPSTTTATIFMMRGAITPASRFARANVGFGTSTSGRCNSVLGKKFLALSSGSSFSNYRLQQRKGACLFLSSRQDGFLREQSRLFSAVANPETVSSNDHLLNDTQHVIPTESTNVVLNSTDSIAEPDPSPKEEGTRIDNNLLLSKDSVERLRSRPVPNGNWNPQDPLSWTKNFGRRSVESEERLRELAQLKPGDEGYFDVNPGERIPGVTIVRTREQARKVVERLNKADPSIFHACDTEVMDINLKEVGPVGNGYVTCLSMYSGPNFDYGLGDGPGSVLWIDNLDDAYGTLQEFKDWFENDKHLKVWHNYGFDRHIMWNEGIDVRGFGGDTMHMARLQDTSRARIGSGNGYGLEALTTELLKDTDEEATSKKSMKELFGVPRVRKDGTEGSLVDIPPVEVMQRDPKHRGKWIDYSCKDAKGTWLIRKKLQTMLENMSWFESKNLYDYYVMHMRPFGEVLTDMERRGIRVDARDYLAKVEVQAREDRKHHSEEFRKWAEKYIGPDGLALNPASAIQLQTFLFGGAANEKSREVTEKIRVFKVPREEIPEEAIEAYKKRGVSRNHGKTRQRLHPVICRAAFLL